MIQKERVRPLNNKREKSRGYVLYWMQAAQRSEYNHALEYAAEQALPKREDADAYARKYEVNHG
ncbi:MAG TPA: hypothetical protein VMW46_05885 [Candidatus Desulfaltia sp.]|nr:hypothetical protein [Candidatus Desulfaltia sp.]